MTFFAQQVSGKDMDDNYILSGLVKRTYQIAENGKCLLSNIQIPLSDEIRDYGDSPDLISHDLDLYAFKQYTDVIVKGTARTPQKNKQFFAEVYIGSCNVSIQVIGKRKVFLNQVGKISITTPEPINEVPLRYDFAYGGRDVLAEKNIKLDFAALAKHLALDFDLLDASPYRYVRNPLGKGFIVELTKESIGQLELPNLEDPEDLLTPDNLIVKDPELWYKMPLPRCTDWVNPAWFPRIAYFGFFNLPENLNYKIPEIVNRWAEPNILSIKPMEGNVNFRCTNGASLGLQLSYVKPGEKIKLLNIHPKFSDFVFQLPSELPNIWVDGRKGKLLPTQPVIHTIVIEPDENRLSIVWRGSAPALRPYFEEELETMPYKIEWNKK